MSGDVMGPWMYRGDFPLDRLPAGQFVRSAGDGTGACEVGNDQDGWKRYAIGDMVPAGMDPFTKDEVDTLLLARCLSSFTLDLSLPEDDGPRWGHMSEDTALKLARYIKAMDKLIEQHMRDVHNDGGPVAPDRGDNGS